MSIRSLSTSTLTAQTRYANMSGVFGAPPFSVEYVVVAGGGGGGSKRAGGGGAGGFLTNFAATPLILNGSFPVKVGAGGPGATSGERNSGTNSVFHNVTATGGGGGGTGNPSGFAEGLNGGSGGGGADKAVGGDGVSGQGNDGGDSDVAGGGGGGGAGGAGQDAVGDGGLGVGSLITGSEIRLAGGGGGGQSADSSTVGGSAVDGGGAGGDGQQEGSDAVMNTGGGGGGGANVGGVAEGLDGGNGGSGVVYIRLPQTATVTKGASHTMNVITDGLFRVYEFTQGDDDITIS